jgi:hypothetical protein
MAQWAHLFTAFGTEDGGHIVIVHDGFFWKIDEKRIFSISAADFVVTIKAMGLWGVFRRRWQLFHGLAASGTEDGCHIVAVHYGLLSKFENERPLISMGAGFAVAVESGGHSVCSSDFSIKNSLNALISVYKSLFAFCRIQWSGATLKRSIAPFFHA